MHRLIARRSRERRGPAEESAQPVVQSRVDGKELVVSVSGRWSVFEERPDWTAPGSTKGIRSLRFDTEELLAWDSSLPLFLLQVVHWSEEQGIDIDRSSLPVGVEKVFARLAATLEEKEDAGSADERGERGGASVLRRAVASLGATVRDEARGLVTLTGELARSCGRCISGRRGLRWRESLHQMRLCGVAALPIVSLISFLVGMILAFQGAVQLRQFGAALFVVDLVDLAVVREMAPVMTAIVAAGRTGSAFAAQLGSMIVGEEVDALETFAISPIDFLVLPRIFALVLMLPLLTLYADVMGILGGLFISTSVLDVSPAVYWSRTLEVLSLWDVGTGLSKSLVFGGLIGLAGCLRGLQAERSAESIGKAATSAVVTGILLVIVADAAAARVFDALGI